MKYILCLLLLSLSGCTTVLCDWMDLCDREVSDEAMATRHMATNSLNEAPLFWPVLDLWIITEPQRN